MAYYVMITVIASSEWEKSLKIKEFTSCQFVEKSFVWPSFPRKRESNLVCRNLIPILISYAKRRNWIPGIACVIILAAFILSSETAMAQDQAAQPSVSVQPEEQPAAPEGYPPSSHENLVKFLLKQNTVDLADNRILDEVGMVLYCDIYEKLYRDEFKWNEFRAAMRKSFAMMKRDGQPTPLSYSAKIKIDRYNQQLKAFEFPENKILLLKKLEMSRYGIPECNQRTAKILPRIYIADFRVPVRLPNLPVPEDIAKKVVEYLAVEYRGERVIFLRLNMLAYDVFRFEEASESRGTAAVLDVWVKSIDVFEDEGQTKYVTTINLREAKSVAKKIGDTSGFTSPFAIPKPATQE